MPSAIASNEAMTRSAIEKTLACTCGRLRKITRRVTQIYDRFLEPSGLSIVQPEGLPRPLPTAASSTSGCGAIF
jgi:hypothetical protein